MEIELLEEVSYDDDHWWCPHHRNHHHRKLHLFVNLLTGTYNPITGVFQMSDTASTGLTVPPDPTSIAVSLGEVTDETGHAVTDTVTTLDTVTSSDASLAADGVVAADGSLGATVETTGTEGTFTVNVTATTASGASVTGSSSPITVAVGPASKVVVNVAIAPPAPAAVPDGTVPTDGAPPAA